nr:hypothetical protein [Arsenicicoccus piscis]
MALIDSFTGLVVDLDGVVYRGDGAVEHAVDALAGRPGSGVGVMYATNNAARPAAEVAEHLTRLGIPTRPEQVVTSAQAGAAMIAERLDEGATVLAVGGPGVALALREVNLEPVAPQDRIDDDAVADRIVGVLQGYGKELTWSDLQEAAYAVRAGALWQATNTDLTIPTGRGISPGNGSAVAAVRNAVDVDPLVAGKPYPRSTSCARSAWGVRGPDPRRRGPARHRHRGGARGRDAVAARPHRDQPPGGRRGGSGGAPPDVRGARPAGARRGLRRADCRRRRVDLRRGSRRAHRRGRPARAPARRR